MEKGVNVAPKVMGSASTKGEVSQVARPATFREESLYTGLPPTNAQPQSRNGTRMSGAGSQRSR